MCTPIEEKLVDIPVDSTNCDAGACESEGTLQGEAEIFQSVLCSSNSPEDQALRNNYSRLCGYLNKFSNRPILKSFKKRWFVFSEKNCKLYYYRSPQDQVPLGEIDISEAAFSFEVNNKGRTGLFTISVPGKDYTLEAANKQTCLFWLQELQKFRRSNSFLRTKVMSDESSSSNTLKASPQSGLLAKSSDIPSSNLDNLNLMDHIDCPNDSVGDDSVVILNTPFSVAQQKFSNLLNQRKSVTGFTNYDRQPIETSLTNTDENVFTSSAKVIKAPSFSVLRSKFSHSFRKATSSDDSKSSGDRHSIKESCLQCQELTAKLENLTDEVSILQDEVSASREVHKVLQRQLDISSKEKETLTQIYQLNDSTDNLKLLSEKDQEIINLRHDIQEEKQLVENLQRLVKSVKNELSELKTKTSVYEELILQKDKTIISLTNDVFDLEKEKQDQKIANRNNSDSSISEIVVPKEEESLEDLKDAVQAIELQNKFMNKELLELNQLRRDSEERVKLMSMKCSEWEARSYQIQSKLLFLLNELNKPGGGSFTQEVVTQLLEEAMGDGTDHTAILPSWSSEKMYDDLGFNWRWGKEYNLVTKATNLKQKSEDITNKVKDVELVSWRVKWDNFLVSLGSKELTYTPELKWLIRQGIPHESKGRIWKGCVQMRIKDFKEKLGPSYYNNLLTSDEYVSKLDPSSKQIELDLLRTLPNNYHYEHIDSDGVPKLRRVLLAYSRHEPSVGYCQGLNRLAAIALLFMDEEDTFWCLVAITKFIMPEGYYSRTLIGSLVDQRLMKEFMAEKLPRIHSHLEQNNVDLSLFTFNWFLTIFVDNIPVETYLRIWDVFLYEGSKVLFRYALAFFKLFENEILQKKDYMSISKYLRTIAENAVDIKRLTHIAFNELNPFPQRYINHKRAQHLLIVKAKLDEMESIRQAKARASKCSSDVPSDED